MKYIVDIPEGYIPVRAKDKSLVFPGNPTFETFDEEKLVRNHVILMHHDVEEMLRDQGREEAWALAQKIMEPTPPGYSPADLKKFFGCTSVYSIITDHTYDEASRIIKTWENVFHVGDVVVLKDVNPVRGVVTNIEKFADEDELCYGVLFEDGMHGSFCSDDLEKTDEHVDLSDIFAKLKGVK